MRQLTLLANKYGTDKGTMFRECHGYTEIYEDYIKKFIGKHPRILEIGIEDGNSLKMWNDFFVGDCEIYAIDIVEDKKIYETENTHIFIQDQGSRTDWEKFKSQFENNCKEFFDIVIEDGSHYPIHQMITLFELCDCVKKGDGIYIMEDLHSNIDRYSYFLNNVNNTETPLFSLSFLEYSPFLDSDENEHLFNNLNDFTLFSHHNNKGEFKERSITAIINFR